MAIAINGAAITEKAIEGEQDRHADAPSPLIAEADVKGVDLNAAGSPLLQ